ncbi:Aste57867_14899 [Aphanomyces stellatus]|uniref:Aste57867_14899 protein n=1 Tax=Aphanomyces stellatus TaxID=120398 RepID=A0A485L3M0_9STRA|nr:hypothetical protein As57867_014843 [Aphanomyces stellatus]VFT91715.1 Aste57867_14899 [Aphanomyces stellatus]
MASRPDDAELPWRDVEVGREASMTNHALKDRVKRIEQVTSDLRSWVARMCIVPLTPLDSGCPTWRDVTLLDSSPLSRQMGKDWIAKRMFHQTNRVFHARDIQRAIYDTSGDLCDLVGLRLVTRGQLVVPLPMNIGVGLLRRHILEIVFFNLLVDDLFAGKLPSHATTVLEETTSTVLHHATVRHGVMLMDTHMLVGVCEENNDRAIVVATSIIYRYFASGTGSALLGLDSAAMSCTPLN